MTTLEVSFFPPLLLLVLLPALMEEEFVAFTPPTGFVSSATNVELLSSCSSLLNSRRKIPMGAAIRLGNWPAGIRGEKGAGNEEEIKGEERVEDGRMPVADRAPKAGGDVAEGKRASVLEKGSAEVRVVVEAGRRVEGEEGRIVNVGEDGSVVEAGEERKVEEGKAAPAGTVEAGKVGVERADVPVQAGVLAEDVESDEATVGSTGVAAKGVGGVGDVGGAWV